MSDGKTNHIVPAKMLLGLIVKVDKEENVNIVAVELIKQVEQNKEIKGMIFDLSKKMTEIVEKKGMFVVLPGFMPPEDSDEGQRAVSEFIENMVKTLSNKSSDSGSVPIPF